MTKRKLAWGAIIVVALLSIGATLWSFFGTDEFSMSEASIQQKIDAKMPHVTKSGVTVSNVKLDLSNDKINLSLDANATKLKQVFDVSGATTGTLRYSVTEGAFYFHPEALELNSFKVNGGNVSEKVGAFIDKWVDSPKINQHKDELAAAAQREAMQLVQAGAEKALEHIPVYRLPDNFKGHIVRMSLTSVEVKNGHVVAHVSFWQLTQMMALYALAFVIAIGFTIALVMNPEWGVPLLLLGAITPGN